MCKMTGTQLSFIASSARFFVGRRRAGIQIFSGDESADRRKTGIFQLDFRNVMRKSFSVVNMRRHAQEAAKEKLKIRTADFQKKSAQENVEVLKNEIG